MKRRSDDMVMSEILDICSNGAGKTRIMYRANLNSAKVNHYLAHMIKNGLIAETPLGQRTSYKTTSKGAMIRAKFERIKGEMDELYGALFTTA